MSEDLTRFAVTRDPALRQQLTVKHLPLVKFVARKMTANLPRYIELDDLVSWGSLGLLDAIDKFDPGREVKFSTYAVTRIRGAILDGLQQMDWAPKQVTSKVRHVRRAIETLGHELNRDPTPEEIATHMDCTAAEVRGWLLDHELQRVRAIDSVFADDGNLITPRTGWEVSSDADQEVAGEVAEIRTRVVAAVADLPQREQEVFVLYYRDDMTLRQVAEEIGVSVSSATQIHTRLVEQVRESLAAYGGAIAV